MSSGRPDEAPPGPAGGEAEAAVAHPGAPLVILGPPGSGRSRLLLDRFWHLLADGCRVEQIAIVTPAQSGASELRSRLELQLVGGYDELHVGTPLELAASLLDRHGAGPETLATVLGPGDRLALLLAHIDEMTLREHDFGGRPSALLAGFVRRIDSLKGELIDAETYARWAGALPDADARAAREREFAAVYRLHEVLLRETGGRDAGDLMREALRLLRGRPESKRPFLHVLLDDAHELSLAEVSLVRALGALTATGAPGASLLRLRGAGDARLRSLASSAARVVRLEHSHRCPQRIAVLAAAAGGQHPPPAERPGGEIAFWRCSSERAQAQAVAADIERLTTRESVQPGRIAVLVPAVSLEGQSVAVALEERAVAHRLLGDDAFFQRAEIRDLLAWLRLLADPTDAGAVVRALARPPVELRSVDIARCTQIARRRKLDMVGALAAATESPQVPPEARERIRLFLALHRAGTASLDTIRPDLYVHRLIERLGLRRQQLFAAQADVVERLRALAQFAGLAAAGVRRSPQLTAREFARQIAAVADSGLREREQPALSGARAVQILELSAAGGLEADHVYVLGLHAGLAAPAPEPVPDELLLEELPPDDSQGRGAALRQVLYVALSRARVRVVLAHPGQDARGAGLGPLRLIEEARQAVGGEWEEVEEELFGPAETLHSTYRLLRDELLSGVARTGGRLGELRFDTDLDIAHAVVRLLELLKVSALIARPEGQALAEALRDVNSRILQAVTSEQREIFGSSQLDDYLLDAERDVRRRAQAVAARDEPSLEQFIPRRGEGIVLSASDIDTYRTCPLKYKFARVFRIPQEPTLHQRFGIAVHQVLERFHAAMTSGSSESSESSESSGSSGPSGRSGGSLPELLGLLDASWRRSGFGDSEEERQLRGKAVAALTRYHDRSLSSDSEAVWFERSFTFSLGPHLLRGRVDRVDRLPGGDYELIDYKTGRPKSAEQLADDVQLSLYAVAAQEAWGLESSAGAYYYLLDDEKISVRCDDTSRAWIREVATEVAEGIRSQGFEPTPSFAGCSLCDYRLICPAAER